MGHVTERQRKARDRAQHIRCLRGMWVQAKQFMTEPRVAVVQAAIDSELTQLGAEPHSSRDRRMREFWRINPHNLPEGMTKEAYDKLHKHFEEPWGGRRFEPLWAKELRVLK